MGLKVLEGGMTVAEARKTKARTQKSVYGMLRNRQVSAHDRQVVCDWSC